MLNSDGRGAQSWAEYSLAEQKAKEEYQKYKRLHSGELSRVEQAFLESVEATAKRLEGK